MNVDIRDATASDAIGISALVSSLAREHIASSLGDGGLETLLASMDAESTRQRIADGWLHLVAFKCDQLCAVIVVKPPQHLYHLFVRSDLHRTGLATKLLDAADARVRRTTGSPIATVNSSLNAVAAYERFGFELDGDVADAHGVPFQPMRRTDSG
jgi:GNAT superfamily N-acetyltransferase